MAYYLSLNHGEQPTLKSIQQGGAVPTADVYVCIGGGGQPLTGMSRDGICNMLQAMANFIRSDSPNKGGANVLAGLKR